jgi:hypothetical protein
MSLLRKIFLLCLALATALVVIAATYPRGGADILQIKYLHPCVAHPTATANLRY